MGLVTRSVMIAVTLAAGLSATPARAEDKTACAWAIEQSLKGEWVGSGLIVADGQFWANAKADLRMEDAGPDQRNFFEPGGTQVATFRKTGAGDVREWVDSPTDRHIDETIETSSCTPLDAAGRGGFVQTVKTKWMWKDYRGAKEEKYELRFDRAGDSFRVQQVRMGGEAGKGMESLVLHYRKK